MTTMKAVSTQPTREGTIALAKSAGLKDHPMHVRHKNPSHPTRVPVDA